MASIIKANQLQDFGGNSILTSDGAGNLTTQKTLYPAFAAYLGSNQSISNATITKMNYDTEVYDTNSVFNTSTYTFTIPSGGAGKYFFFARQTVAGAVAGDKHIFYLYKNNSQAALLSRSVGRGDDDSIQISAFVDASVSDYFDIRYYHNFGSTKTVESNSTRTVFGAYRIGS